MFNHDQTFGHKLARTTLMYNTDIVAEVLKRLLQEG